jgi:hypothetical protein
VVKKKGFWMFKEREREKRWARRMGWERISKLALWLTPVIPATQKAEIRRTAV